MPCSELFWLNFLEVFPKALGFSLGILPAALAFWGGLFVIISGQDRLDARQRAEQARLDAAQRGDAGDERLRHRVAYLEGRLLPFDEARRQREG